MLDKYQVRECLTESHSQTMISVSGSCIDIAMEKFLYSTDPDLLNKLASICIIVI